MAGRFGIGFNNTFLNSTALPMFNDTARLTVNNVPNLLQIVIGVAYDSAFILCPSTKCQNKTYDDSLGIATFDVTSWTNYTVMKNTAPTVPVLIFPDNNNFSILDTIPIFKWFNSTDLEGDAITYEINITHPLCPDIYEINISEDPENSTYAPSIELCTTLDGTQEYNWTVRAFDGYTYSDWALPYAFKINATLILSLTANNIVFGSKQPGETDNTTDDSPSPFVIENEGNILADILYLYAQDGLFDSVALNTSYFQFKVDNTTEIGSFNYSNSTTIFTNILSLTTGILSSLDYHNISDTVEIDLLITVPQSEPVGTRSSNLIFIGEAS